MLSLAEMFREVTSTFRWHCPPPAVRSCRYREENATPHQPDERHADAQARTRRLGEPCNLGNTLAVAGYLEISTEVLAEIRSAGGFAEPVLWEPVGLAVA